MQVGRGSPATRRPRRERAGAGAAPARQAGASASARRSWCSRCSAPGGCRSARCCAAFERAFAARVGAANASAVSSGTAGLHLALRAVGVGDGSEVVTSPFSFVASANVAVYERARPVFADIDPVTLNLDPGRGRRRGHLAHGGAAAGACVRLPGRHRGVRGARPADRRGRLRGARRARMPTAARSAAAGHPAVFGFYANKQLTTGEGGIVTLRRRIGQAADRLRAQSGPGAGHGLA